MYKKVMYFVWICVVCAACFALCGCGVQLDESMLTAEANYDIDIYLPYATATPLPEIQVSVDALVIDEEGSVYVNDTSVILEDSADFTEDPDSNYKSLRLGNTGLAVQALQARLQELGYFTQGISGIFDANTEAAVRRFEQTYGTMQTGVATAELQSRLFAADALVYASEAYNEAVVSQYAILQRGDVGSAVYALQQRLKNLGYPLDELTGIFDNETANAVMLFYEAYGLTASDIANVALQKELYSDSAKPYGDSGSVTASESLAVMTAEDISAIQRRLSELGFYAGEINGNFDRSTEIAVKLFEEACGELPSGTLSRAVLTLMESSNAPTFASLSAHYPNLLEGSSGEGVSHLQHRLVALGFAKGTPNGEYGPATTASVKLFQAANGLEENGVASSYMQAVLYSAFALNIDGETIVTIVEETQTVENIPEETVEEVPEAPAETGTLPEHLNIGSTGDDVILLQNRLTSLGYVTSVTGTYDNLTSRAVSSVQTALGVEATGLASRDLLELIYSNAVPSPSMTYHKKPLELSPLAPGDSGDAVEDLQKRLWELGYLAREDVEDSIGSYHEATADAVLRLQTDLLYQNPSENASAEFQCYLLSEFSDAMKKEAE